MRLYKKKTRSERGMGRERKKQGKERKEKSKVKLLGVLAYLSLIIMWDFLIL